MLKNRQYRIFKMSFINLDTDKVRQFGQGSADTGKTRHRVLIWNTGEKNQILVNKNLQHAF
jgi:hypothetical protein